MREVSSTQLMENVIAMVLAGGKGQRLYPLTKSRAKPAVPFGGIYRIIDFTLSNCMHSGVRRIFVLTQHKSLTLDRHLREAWSIFRPEFNEFLETVPPQQFIVSRWYAGTADAVFQNIYLLEQERPEHVLILSGDHVYKMDYRRLLEYHVAKAADLTIACVEVDRKEAHRYGIIEVDESWRIVGFSEKPRNPKPLPSNPHRSLASMGVYIFRTEALVRAVIRDAKRNTEHDFGRNIIPDLVQRGNVFAFNIRIELPSNMHYWRDIGAIDSYYEANMELLQSNPPFDLFDEQWRVRTHVGQYPPALIHGRKSKVERCLISPGATIRNAVVRRSIISYGVRIESGAKVEGCILMPKVVVGSNCQLRHAIIDEGVHVPSGISIGVDIERDAKQFVVTSQGITVVPSGVIIQECNE